MKRALLLLLIVIMSFILVNTINACNKEEEFMSHYLSAIDPTAITNPEGANFPGFRGGNQLIKYTSKFGQSTGTNEYGTEITIVEGRVTGKNGSDSLIPEHGFVLSGHGDAKKWLNNNTIIGTYIKIDTKNKLIKAMTKPESYIFRTEMMIKQAIDSIRDNNNHLDNNLLLEARKYTDDAQSKLEEAKDYLDSKDNVNSIKVAKEAYKIAELAFYKSIPPMNNIEKGIWCRPVEKNIDEIKNTIQKIKRAGIKTVYLETFYHGYTIYPSDVATSYGFKKQNPNFESFDPLAEWTKLAHSEDLKVIPWVETFYAGTGTPGPILSIKPEWANIQRLNTEAKTLKPSTTEPGAYFIDPANPEVREYLQKLFIEIVSNYDVDGLNLDYIRYPNSLPVYFPNYLESTWGYSDIARNEFKKQFKTDPLNLSPSDELWNEWVLYRQKNVNSVVKEIYSSIKKAKPSLDVSAVVFPKEQEAQLQKLQDWQSWVNGGYIDVLTPIILGSSPELIKQYSNTLSLSVKGTARVYIGVFGAFNNDLPVIFIQQITATRNTGISGINIFDLAHLNDDYIKALTEGPYKNNN